MTKNEMLKAIAAHRAQEIRRQVGPMFTHMNIEAEDINMLELEMKVREGELAEAIANEISGWTGEEIRFYYMLMKHPTYKSICQRLTDDNEAFFHLGAQWMETICKSAGVM